ncbi:hypothetical protein UlMin_030187, partial [Ulmus minor]
LKDCMKKGYSYLEGVEELLCSLRQKNYEMHTFTNYPIWYEMIEDKLQISRYLSWTFCSCKNGKLNLVRILPRSGKRKPDPDFYLDALEHLEVDPANYTFVDDRTKNVEAAIAVGIVGLHFKNILGIVGLLGITEFAAELLTWLIHVLFSVPITILTVGQFCKCLF